MRVYCCLCVILAALLVQTIVVLYVDWNCEANYLFCKYYWKLIVLEPMKMVYCFIFFVTGCAGINMCVNIFFSFFFVLGFPTLGVEWQKMENPDLRKAMGMAPDQKGVRIRRIEPTAPESQFLKPSDIILSFDGIDIANDGTGEHFDLGIL